MLSPRAPPMGRGIRAYGEKSGQTHHDTDSLLINRLLQASA